MAVPSSPQYERGLIGWPEISETDETPSSYTVINSVIDNNDNKNIIYASKISSKRCHFHAQCDETTGCSLRAGMDGVPIL
ncbi:hypothetical protein SADUNF_Sadunf05G0048400 [Salix dunnii]|uniref:Uncharacterized protein n=1 Tax=Salix dunnii TaxID=1413687 RepID=A0A835MYG3_9ROSI|nr:hypothetical protein SADUNF_Sadunf05G0048400 [Salix dunnii]